MAREAVSAAGERILGHLAEVARERGRREADPAHAQRVGLIKQYQHARFASTYADLLASPRFGQAATFFLNDLYGPHDFTQRDAQFARIVPALVRLFPREIVHTVEALAALHALSERLDAAMAEALPEEAQYANALSYGRAWRAIGRADEREQQIGLMLAVGESLDQYTRKPLMRHTLRLMRVPAQAAGMAALQQFLETGFDTFAQMRGAAPFLQTIAQRERGLAEALFADGGA